MSDSRPEPVVKRSADIEYKAAGAADGMSKGVFVSGADDAPSFATRRFAFDPGASAPKHTNEIKHEQYVLSGRYVVGIDDEKYEVEVRNSLPIPAGVAHWYRNKSDTERALPHAIPNGDDIIGLAADIDV